MSQRGKGALLFRTFVKKRDTVRQIPKPTPKSRSNKSALVLKAVLH